MRVSHLKLPIIAAGALLLLALVTLGVGYGLWSKVLTVEGTVETGSVDARWLTAFCVEFHSWPDLPRSVGDYGEYEGKDVGETTFEIDPDDDQILHLRVTNGYPSYAVDCEVNWEIEGSIPVRMRGTTIVPVSHNLNDCELTGDQTKTLRCDELTVIFVDGIGSQLHPGEWGANSIIIHIEQEAEQLETYLFDVGICLAQWNESASAEECFAAAPAH